MTLYRATAQGRIAMTPEEEAEFEASRAPSAAEIKTGVLAKINQLERDSMLNRGSRELEIVNLSDLATRKAEKFKADNPADERTIETLAAEYLAATSYYAKLTALDAQITALRAQL
jgi:hypothetical protein